MSEQVRRTERETERELFTRVAHATHLRFDLYDADPHERGGELHRAEGLREALLLRRERLYRVPERLSTTREEREREREREREKTEMRGERKRVWDFYVPVRELYWVITRRRQK